MPVARLEAHRLRSGTYTSSSITSTYAITAWTVANDQKSDSQVVVPWLPPYQMLPLEYARVTQNLDGSSSADGFLQGIFGPFPYWTHGMLSYFLSTYLAAGVRSAAASAMFYDVTDTAQYLNLTIHRPVAGQDMEPVFGGWANVRIRCDFGTVVS